MDTPYSPGPFHLERGVMGNWAIRDVNGFLVGEVNTFFRGRAPNEDRQIDANAALLVSADLTYELLAEVYELYYREWREPELLQHHLAQWITKAAPVIGSVGHGTVPFDREATYVERLRKAQEKPDSSDCRLRNIPARNRSVRKDPVMTIVQMLPPDKAMPIPRPPSIDVSTTELACMMCNRDAGVLVTRPNGMTLVRLDEPNVAVTGIKGMRCVQCGGNVLGGEVTTRREHPPEIFQDSDGARRGRPPRWLIQMREAAAAANIAAKRTAGN